MNGILSNVAHAYYCTKFLQMPYLEFYLFKCNDNIMSRYIFNEKLSVLTPA